MNKNINLIVANASGNITIMVLTPTSRKDYKETARQLLQMKELGGEQVAFLLPEKTPSQSKKTPPQTGFLTEIPPAPLPQMEMCGLEFCGNASRAFALYIADTKKQDIVTIKTSGCEKPLTARIFPDKTVEMEMPVPSGIQLIPAKELSIQKDGILVKMDGIAHLILEDIAPTMECFETIKDHIYKTTSPALPAFGVMFCDTANQCMTPVVYVKDVDTTYFEGSCASGTVAASFALAKNKPDGIHAFTMQQPEGVLHTTVTKKEVLNTINEFNFKNFMLAIRGAGFISPKLVRSKMALDFAYTLYLVLKKNKSIDDVSDSEAKRIVQRWYVLSVLTGRKAVSPRQNR